MKKLPLILIIAVLAVAAVLYFARNTRTEKFQIVTLSGVGLYAKVIDMPDLFLAGNNPDWVSALPLSDNDLLLFGVKSNGRVDPGEVDRFYKYSQSDGTNLHFREEGFKLFLNDRLISVSISRDTAVLDWLNTLTPKETADLRQLEIQDSVSGPFLEGLKKLAELRSDLGLVIIDGRVNTEDFLKIFNPTWLYGELNLSDAGLDRLYSLTGIEFLLIDNKALDPERLPDLKKLKKLVIDGFVLPHDGKKLNLPDNLQSLTIGESGIKNLEFLGSAKGLRELKLIKCDSISDISLPAGLKKLTGIGFSGCSTLADLSPLDQIPDILRFSFPESVDAREFSRFIGTHKKLKMVELFGCKNIADPEPLKELPDLSCLSIYSDTIIAETLFGFNKLDYLMIGGTLPEDSLKLNEAVKELQGKLPNTIIVPSAGLCLGTGWLLLVIPLLLLFRLSVFFYRKRIRA